METRLKCREKHPRNGSITPAQGWRQEFSDGGADSSDEGAKIWFSGYYKCQNLRKNRFSPSDGGLACSDEGAIAP